MFVNFLDKRKLQHKYFILNICRFLSIKIFTFKIKKLKKKPFLNSL